jgi:hypothetical protein
LIYSDLCKCDKVVKAQDIQHSYSIEDARQAI